MIQLFNKKTEKKINIRIFSSTKKYTKGLMISYFSFYNWREIARIKEITDEILTEFEFLFLKLYIWVLKHLNRVLLKI